MPPETTGQDWTAHAAHDVRVGLWADHLAERLPLTLQDLAALDKKALPDGGAEDTNSHAEIVDLTDGPDAWQRLHARFTAARDGATSGPWNRCLTILAGHKAVTCVIERNYVCLDYKSEIVSFYAQLDQARGSTATRLHFFAQPVDDASLHTLSDKQRDSYLGYIVCRDGALPLVGRTTIKPPAYVSTVATVEERVHFYAQTLTVHGTPFMQQDSRLAVCSQVAVWAIHYSAYRSGLVQRRVVAELVSMSGVMEPMRPQISGGLRTDEVEQLFRRSGLSARTYGVLADGAQDLPRIPAASVPGAAEIVAKTQPLIADGHDLRSARNDLALFATDLWRHAVGRTDAGSTERRLAEELQDLLIHHIVMPYLQSGTPVYVGTDDHAMVICGTSGDPGNRTFFVHDDQYGPYLAMPSLINGSRATLQDQAYHSKPFPRIRLEDDFPEDRAAAVCAGTRSVSEDGERTATEVVVPGPSRLVVSGAQAEVATYILIARSRRTAHTDIKTTDGHKSSPSWWRPYTTTMMGIDYKHRRREALIAQGDLDGARFVANLHLAEWVIVVQDGTHATDANGARPSDWEIVYDGSSGSETPLVQFARMGPHVVATHPLSDLCQEMTTDPRRWPIITPPSQVGKNHTSL